MSKLYIIAGCNGAGKTTASYTVLPEILECREFVNADEIAKGLSPFNLKCSNRSGTTDAETHQRTVVSRSQFFC